MLSSGNSCLYIGVFFIEHFEVGVYFANSHVAGFKIFDQTEIVTAENQHADDV